MLSFLDGKVEVWATDEFWLDLDGRGNETMWDRADLTALRNAIDQALNTSQDEIDAAADA